MKAVDSLRAKQLFDPETTLGLHQDAVLVTPTELPACPDGRVARKFCSNEFRCWQIVLKKSFFADDRKFSGPLVRLSRCEVRDHINCRKNDRWRS
jgi:hypothetical protein